MVDGNGLEGVVIEDARVPSTLERHLFVRFENALEVFVPVDSLSLGSDGRYYLDTRIEDLHTAPPHGVDLANTDAPDSPHAHTDQTTLVVPVIDETLTVQIRQRESGVVEIRKTIHERTETVDPPLYAEEVQVERVAVNRFVDAPVPVRQDEETTIIPLLEEVLVVEKRLLLREEVHIRKARREVHNRQTVTLRDERVDVVRRPDGKPDHHQPSNTQ